MEQEGDEVTYLGVDDVLLVHAKILGIPVDVARNHLRSLSRLEGALARPLWQAHYNRADLPAQAAALAHSIAEGQLFVDGNKRTALGALRLFLLLNGFDVTATQRERADWILRLASGGTVEELAATLRESVTLLG